MRICITTVFSSPPVGRWNLKGFTLIELLVVTLILAVVATLISVNFTDRGLDKRLSFEAQRLAAVIDLARDQALVTGQELGFIIEGNRYYFSTYNEQKKRFIEITEKPFNSHSFNDFLLSDLTNPGSSKVVFSKFKRASGSKIIPHILLLSSGECTPFSLLLSSGSQGRWRIQSNGFTKTEVSDFRKS